MKLNKKEMNKVWKDVKKNNFGVYDPELKKRINPMNLAFFWGTEKKNKIRQELVLHRDLGIIEDIYKKRFGTNGEGALSLDKWSDPELFVERLIRAVEICTLRYVLNKGGYLNKYSRMSIVKGKRSFIWELY